MRVWPVLALLTLSLFAGCTDAGEDAPVSPPDLGYDPSTVRPTGFRKEAFDVSSFDGTNLAAVAYVPRTTDTLPDGSPPTWPTVVFLHGWGLFKEQFEGTEALREGLTPPAGNTPPEFQNTLAHFAAEGFVAVAYDARGFGQSGGQTTIAGPAEQADLRAVLDAVQERFPTGRIGLAGVSYGAGQALMGWAEDPRIETAVAVFAWHDLYDAVMPNDVPKLAWAQALLGLGVGGAGGQAHPMLADWYTRAYTREGLDEMEAQMDVRSVGDGLANTTKPLLVCQARQDSLMQQVHTLGTTAAGFTRTYIHPGGHTFIDPGCLDRSLDWFHFFLGGFATGVESWPALEVQDDPDADATSYRAWPEAPMDTFYLRAPDLARGPSPETTFTIRQQVSGNPLADPPILSDVQGPQELPEQSRDEPGMTTFATAPLAEPGILVGSPVLWLTPEDANATQWQVTARLVHAEADGTSRILARGAWAQVEENGTEQAQIVFPFVRQQLAAGDTILLQLAPNDPSWWMPLFVPYEVTFTGETSLDLPVQR